MSEDKPVSLSIEEWDARKDEDLPLPPGMVQQGLFGEAIS